MLETFLTFMVLVLAGALVWQYRRNQAESRRREKRDRVAGKEVRRERNQLLDALGDGFLLVNDTSQIVFANACARKIVNGRRLKGRSIMEAFLDDQLSVAIMKCIRTKKAMQERVVLRSAYTPLGSAGGEQGVSAWVIDAAPLETHGHENLTRVVLRDVTAEYQADQVRRDFVANASHELRTPMAIINGYLENLLDDGLLDEPEMARKFLGIMRKHGERISRLVEDMLVISKMESGNSLVLKKEGFVFKDCVRDVVERLDSMITKQRASIVMDGVPEELCLHGDRFYWTQVIFNLVENALKQNPDTPLTVEVSAKTADDSVRISVCDNGVGIPSEDLPYIFKRFYRVDKHHTQSDIKGTGLGLSIVRRAIEAHGGEITATSVPGQRTCFVIEVPVGENC